MAAGDFGGGAIAPPPDFQTLQAAVDAARRPNELHDASAPAAWLWAAHNAVNARLGKKVKRIVLSIFVFDVYTGSLGSDIGFRV